MLFKIEDYMPDFEKYFCGDQGENRSALDMLQKDRAYDFSKEYKYAGPLCCYDVDLWRRAKKDGATFDFDSVIDDQTIKDGNEF